MATPEKFTSLVEKECGYLLLDELNIFIGLKIIVLTRKFSCVNARGIPTVAYQVLPRWGTPPARSNREGVPRVGYPLPGSWLWEGVPGVPPLGYPSIRVPPSWLQGVPRVPPCPGSRGVPGVPPLRYPHSGSGGFLGYSPSGYPPLEYPPVGVPPILAWGGTQGTPL